MYSEADNQRLPVQDPKRYRHPRSHCADYCGDHTLMGTILVTGAAGFIGSHVSELLLKRGEHVIGYDNLDPYYDPRIKRRNVNAPAILSTSPSSKVTSATPKN